MSVEVLASSSKTSEKAPEALTACAHFETRRQLGLLECSTNRVSEFASNNFDNFREHWDDKPNGADRLQTAIDSIPISAGVGGLVAMSGQETSMQRGAIAAAVTGAAITFAPEVKAIAEPTLELGLVAIPATFNGVRHMAEDFGVHPADATAFFAVPVLGALLWATFAFSKYSIEKISGQKSKIDKSAEEWTSSQHLDPAEQEWLHSYVSNQEIGTVGELFKNMGKKNKGKRASLESLGLSGLLESIPEIKKVPLAKGDLKKTISLLANAENKSSVIRDSLLAELRVAAQSEGLSEKSLAKLELRMQMGPIADAILTKAYNFSVHGNTEGFSPAINLKTKAEGGARSLKINIKASFAKKEKQDTIMETLVKGLEFMGREEGDSSDSKYIIKMIPEKGVTLFKKGKNQGVIETIE